MTKKIAVVGAGLSGATAAFELAHRLPDTQITVFEQRKHIAGNVYTRPCMQTDVVEHVYGPHIFHTNDEATWKWFDHFAELQPYTQRTKGISNGQVYSLPINLHTINQFYGRVFTPNGARAFIRSRSRQAEAYNFEDYAIAVVGEDLYAAFLRDYTKKQWGVDPKLLPSSILKRLPIRFSYEDNAYSHRFQGIPKYGYTEAVANMLAHPRIEVAIGEKFTAQQSAGYDHTFVSAPIDEWFDYVAGKLSYRTLDFSRSVVTHLSDAQGCAVMNHCDFVSLMTRTTEHKHFMPWRETRGSILTSETPRQHEIGDVHFYPMGLPDDNKVLGAYQELAADFRDKMTFIGRLGTYRYLDMDRAIAGARAEANAYIRRTAYQT